MLTKTITVPTTVTGRKINFISEGCPLEDQRYLEPAKLLRQKREKPIPSNTVHATKGKKSTDMDSLIKKHTKKKLYFTAYERKIIDVLYRANRRLSLKSISKRIGEEEGAVYNIISSLIDRQHLYRYKTGTYELNNREKLHKYLIKNYGREYVSK